MTAQDDSYVRRRDHLLEMIRREERLSEEPKAPEVSRSRPRKVLRRARLTKMMPRDEEV